MSVLRRTFQAKVRGVEPAPALPQIRSGQPTLISACTESSFHDFTIVHDGTVRPCPSFLSRTNVLIFKSRNAVVAVRSGASPNEATAGFTHCASHSGVHARMLASKAAQTEAGKHAFPTPLRLRRRVFLDKIQLVAATESMLSKMVKQTPTAHMCFDRPSAQTHLFDLVFFTNSGGISIPVMAANAPSDARVQFTR